MNSHPKISVIIPIYNGEKHIAECLDSVYRSTFKDFEVIVVNDGSTDKTEEEIQKVIKMLPLLIYTGQGR